MPEITVHTEPVDDIPLLLHQQQTMGLVEVIDRVIPRHGNRAGLSLGWMICGWLAYILSESDHRLSYVEGWAQAHLQTLNSIIPHTVRATDFSDDRLGDALQQLSVDAHWEQIEAQLSRQLIQVYQLPTETVRVDSTTVALYHDPEASTLVAHGYSKDHRPDLAQVKVMLATMDPLALPVVTLVVSGQQADEGLYVPALQQAQQTLGPNGLLYVGDSKMEALATRAHLVQRGDYYLVPLSRKGTQRELLAEKVAYVLTEKPERIPVYPAAAAGETDTLLAQGWESTRPQVATIDETPVQWSERLLLIYSPTLARSAARGLEKRLRTAEAQLARLTPTVGRGKRPYRTLAPLQAAVENILQQHRVTEFLQVNYQQHVTERHIRKYKDQPARTETRMRYEVVVTRDAVALQAVQRTLGWRLYATNAPTTRLTLADAVRTYRGTVPTIERLFARLKGRPLGLRPVFVHRDDHIQGLIRLLSLALRILTLIEFVTQRSLRTEPASLAGLYPGNPTRTTDHPTTDRLLRAFKGITLSLIDLPDQHIRHISPLSPLQNRILSLLKCSTNIYADLSRVSSIPP